MTSQLQGLDGASGLPLVTNAAGDDLGINFDTKFIQAGDHYSTEKLMVLTNTNQMNLKSFEELNLQDHAYLLPYRESRTFANIPDIAFPTTINLTNRSRVRNLVAA